MEELFALPEGEWLRIRPSLARLRRLAAQWLAEHPTGAGCDVRFDVVSVWPQARGAARVEHLRGAF